ncbi:MAG: hypothetical protein DHS20C01_20620 [marine bacterium B5-7]|nr:MAG: hypothetical protein DHS20C01_20620 [marine bacterium B5-7]
MSEAGKHDTVERCVKAARGCRLCADRLPLGPRPVIRARASARILIVGQAPGTRVHETGIPWNDASGRRLREWLNLSEDKFYDDHHIAIVPAGLCYPGKGKSGDLPPIPECAPLWHGRLRPLLTDIRLTLLIGQYAQSYYLGKTRKKTLTETVQAWRDYQPEYLPLPHPSPRNTAWLRNNDWFETQVVPMLRIRVSEILDSENINES